MSGTGATSASAGHLVLRTTSIGVWLQQPFQVRAAARPWLCVCSPRSAIARPTEDGWCHCRPVQCVVPGRPPESRVVAAAGGGASSAQGGAGGGATPEAGS